MVVKRIELIAGRYHKILSHKRAVLIYSFVISTLIQNKVAVLVAKRFSATRYRCSD